MDNFKPESIQNKQDNQAESKDIKALQKENEELKSKNENLEASLKVIAHDLRGPLGALDRILSLYNQIQENNEEVSIDRETFNTIVKSSNGIYKLLEDLLDLYKNSNPEIASVPLLDQIQEVINQIKENAKSKGIHLESTVSGDMKVMADTRMLQTVIRNLASNAIKFVKEGGSVIISAEDTNGEVVIRVADDGVGMSEELKEKLFNQIVTSKDGTGGEKGSGLGLSLCGKYVNEMGGKINVESTEGSGSTFIVTLPSGEK